MSRRAALQQVEALAPMLTRAGQTLVTAESCTGGLIANRLTDVSGASEVFRYGFVTYANEADAQRAQEEYDGTELDGRRIRVNEAQERGGRGGGGGGGRGGRGGGGGGGGGRW